MKVLSLFSGIGAFEKALDVLKIPYELAGYCEIDKYASKSYSAIHDVPETMNLGDITKIDEKALPKDIDLITYGFPCQDISLAGKQKGLFNEDGSQTRSGLFFEALRIIEETQPKVAIAENVKNLTGKKFNAQFQIVLASLEAAGYNNYWQVLNAKDYGIPQNRERVFIVSIRKDIDTGNFKFPEVFPLELRLKDMLEDEVDEKFYLNKDFSLIQTNSNVVGMVDMKGDECIRRIYDVEKEAPTLTTMEGGHRQPKVLVDPKVLVREATKKGYAEAVEGGAINLEQPNSKTRRDRVGHGVAQTLTTSPQQGVVVKDAKPIKLGFFKYPNSDKAHQSSTFYDVNGVSPTLDACGGGNTQVKIAEPFIVANRGVVVSEPKIEILGNYSPSGHDASRIVSVEGIAPTVKENHGTVTAVVVGNRWIDGVGDFICSVCGYPSEYTSKFCPNCGAKMIVEPCIQRVDIPQTVKVRKYPVDTKLLCECLRDYKFASNFSNKEIAEILNVPLTKVEHWFRQDDCFSIPEPELWLKLKSLLGIETDEFDKSIMTFEEKEGVFEKSERHYFAEGIAPTLTSTTAGNEKIITTTSVEPPIASFVNGDVCKTVRASGHGSIDRHSWDMVHHNLRIRKLTPKECFRLMGFTDEDFAKAEAVNSNTQLYKQAGNSIVVDVIVHIFTNLNEGVNHNG